MPRYSATLMDHFNSPRNAGDLPSANAFGQGNLYGRAPYVDILLRIEDAVIQQANFKTFGCGATIASCSAFTELITGMEVERALKVTAREVIEALDGLPAEKEFCAQFVIDALHDAVTHFEPPQ